MIKKNETIIGIILIFLEITLLFALFSLVPNNVTAEVGNPVTVITNLTVGNVYPEIINVSLNGQTDITLTPNTTTEVSCVAVLRDYNGEGDIENVNATLYDLSVSPNDPDDNNNHYTNSSCDIIADTQNFNGYPEDAYHALANCTFQVEYYANPTSWTCNVTVNDSMSWEGQNWNNVNILQLLALGLPDVIEYGTVNATEVSDEQTANVTNLGNAQINLTLEGYGETPDDDLAMVCTLGNIGEISIDYEKYNLTASTPGTQTLSQFETNYINLTSSGVTPIKKFELNYRQNDVTNEAIKESYWRIYVPKGVAGTCNGTIIFGATTSPEN